MQLIGKIFHHGYIQLEIFPIILSNTTLKQYLFSNISNADLIQRFLEFSPSKEKKLLLTFREVKLIKHKSVTTIFKSMPYLQQ